MGLLDHFSNWCNFTSTRRALKIRKKKKKPLQTVQIKVKMDCEGCERRVKHAVLTMRRHVDPKKVLQRVRRRGKLAEFWPYTPHNLVFYPCAAGAYDPKAPTDFVRRLPQAMPSPGGTMERYSSLSSDDNPNACSVM